jgi:hypothetical protein
MKTCIDCGNPISPKRLSIYPKTKQCISCYRKQANGTNIIPKPLKYSLLEENKNNKLYPDQVGLPVFGRRLGRKRTPFRKY